MKRAAVVSVLAHLSIILILALHPVVSSHVDPGMPTAFTVYLQSSEGNSQSENESTQADMDRSGQGDPTSEPARVKALITPPLLPPKTSPLQTRSAPKPNLSARAPKPRQKPSVDTPWTSVEAPKKRPAKQVSGSAPTASIAASPTALAGNASLGQGDAQDILIGSNGSSEGETSSSGTDSHPPRYRLGAHRTPLPDYPWGARRRGQEGRVVVRLFVDATGHPTQSTILVSSGVPDLDHAAQTTLMTWTLDPAIRLGAAVDAVVDVPIRFQLK